MDGEIDVTFGSSVDCAGDVDARTDIEGSTSVDCSG